MLLSWQHPPYLFFMRILFCSLFFFLPSLSFCQENLIPNPSFEDLSDCPNIDPLPTPNLLELAPPWYGVIGTPDLCNSCAGSGPGTFGVPGNFQNNFQYPKTGEGYSGIVTFYTIGRTTEFMGIKLKKKLNANTKHYIVFNTTPRDGQSLCFSDEIGLAFPIPFTKKLSISEKNLSPISFPPLKIRKETYCPTP
ncbi:MAG: hypothetical protein IPG32_20085 [Saprospirales bacterium]|nr:hypothetical protein [Saprospirales bacterium]